MKFKNSDIWFEMKNEDIEKAEKSPLGMKYLEYCKSKNSYIYKNNKWVRINK